MGQHARNAAEYVRDLRAQRAVLHQLATAHDRLSEAEQVAVLTGDDEARDAAHTAALRTLRAYRAEQDDPER